MHFAVISRVLGVLLMMFSLTLLVPISVSLWFNDHNYMTFLWGFALAFGVGLALWAPFYKTHADLRTRDGFLITALFWFVLASFGATPLYLSNGLELSFTDALFESISGFTTTGATVITGLDTLPPSILFYRQQLQWFGGIGIIVIAVAVLPMLGIGGMQLYRAETPGPVKDNKLTPRITGTAKALFGVYLVITIACAIAYHLLGMNWFQAISHSFSTVANGGFSTHDASIQYYDSPAILMVCSLFMLISGVNFALHFLAWQGRSAMPYLQDAEFRFFIGFVTVGCIITIAYLAGSQTYGLAESAYLGIFNFISTITTAGFAADFSSFPSFLPYMIFIAVFVGGCAGSSAGGIKAIRVLLLYKQGMREIERLVHPNAVIAVKVGKVTVSDQVIEAVWGFFVMYVVAYIAMFLLLIATGLNLETSFSAVGASITNLGPGMGDVASNYKNINDPAKWVLCFAMLLGRLEVFTLLVLFTPAFWRR